MDIFKDLKVIELASVLAGPSVGMFFAELGAKVIKIENKTTGGDVTRRWKNDLEDTELPVSAYYSSVNFYKEVVFADLKDEGDRDAVLAEISTADIVICNFKKGSAARLKMDYAHLKTIKSDLIYAQINGMSEGDDRPAFDVVLQAETGFISMTGEEGGGYVKMPVALIDLLAAHQLKQAILVALYNRERTGDGAYTEVSLYESGLASLANQASNFLMTGFIPKPMGTRHPNICPYGDVLESKDGIDFVIAIGTEKQWESVCDYWKLDTQLKQMKNSERVKNRSLIIKACRKVTSRISSEILFDDLKKLKIPFGVIKNLREVLEGKEAEKMIIEESQEGVFKRGIKSVGFHIFYP